MSDHTSLYCVISGAYYMASISYLTMHDELELIAVRCDGIVTTTQAKHDYFV